MLRSISLCCALVSLAVATNCVAQTSACGLGPDVPLTVLGGSAFIEFSPTSPAAGLPIPIAVTMSNYVDASASASVAGNVIDVTLIATHQGFDPPPPFDCATTTMAGLAAGNYAVNLFLVDPTVVAPSPILVATTTLSVGVLTLVQSVSPSGSTLLHITGFELPCAMVGQTSVPTIAQNVITITTTTIGGEVCFPEPPPPTPIDIAVDLGHLPPGHYLVTWLFPVAFPPTVIQFDVGAVPPIPTLNPAALLLLLGALGVLGMFSLRERASVAG